MEVASLSMSIDSSPLDKAKKSMDATHKSAEALEGVVKKLAVVWAAIKFSEHAKEAFMASARYETLGVVMTRVGANIGYTGAQMEEFSKTLQKTGISMTESRNTVIQMAGAQMDLANSAKLARLAQDAAVIGNINSSEAFQRLVHGIKSGETEILRTMGINVQFEQAYNKLAMTLGKTKDALSDTEKVTARTNAVMEFGKRIAGSYEASMGTMGKQILSAVRYVQDLTVSLGEFIRPVAAIVMVPLLKWLEDSSKKMKAFVESADGKKMIASIVDPLTSIADVIGKVGSWAAQGVKALEPFADILKGIAGIIGFVLVGAGIMWLAVQGNMIATTIISTVTNVANVVSIIAQAAATEGLTVALAAAQMAATKFGVSMSLAAVTGGVMLIALIAIAAATYAAREETEKLNEQNAIMEERITKVLDPLMQQREILRQMTAEQNEYNKAKSAGKSDKEAAAMAEKARKQAELESKYRKMTENGAKPEHIEWARQMDSKQAILEANKKKREEEQKKAEEEQKRTADLLKRKKDDLRKMNEEEQKSIILMQRGASAAYEWGLTHQKAYSQQEAALSNKYRLNQMYRESVTELNREAEALKMTAIEAAVYKKVKETGMDKGRARELATKEAENKALEEQRDLMKELRPLQISARDFYMEQAKDNGVSDATAAQNWQLKQAIQYTTEMKAAAEELNTVRNGELDTFRRRLSANKTMSEQQIDDVVFEKSYISFVREEMQLREQLSTLIESEAAVRDRAREKAGMSSEQRRTLQTIQDEMDVARVSDPNIERRRQLAASERILGLAREKGHISAKRLAEEEHNLLIAGMQLRADGGSMWAEMGLAFATTNDKVADGLTSWIMNIDAVENKWVSLRDTMRNVFASMLSDMAKANFKEGLQPLMDGAGSLIEKGGNAASGYLMDMIGKKGGSGGESVDISAMTSQFTDLSKSLSDSTTELMGMGSTSATTSAIMELLGITTSTTSATTSAEMQIATAATTVALYELATAAYAAAAAQAGEGIAGAMATGGTALAGKTYLIGEKGPELFTPSATGTITPNDHIAIAPAPGSGGGGGAQQINQISITVQVDQSGQSTSSSSQVSNSDGIELARMVEAKTMEVIQRQTEPGGILHQNR